MLLDLYGSVLGTTGAFVLAILTVRVVLIPVSLRLSRSLRALEIIRPRVQALSLAEDTPTTRAGLVETYRRAGCGPYAPILPALAQALLLAMVWLTVLTDRQLSTALLGHWMLGFSIVDQAGAWSLIVLELVVLLSTGAVLLWRERGQRRSMIYQGALIGMGVTASIVALPAAEVAVVLYLILSGLCTLAMITTSIILQPRDQRLVELQAWIETTPVPDVTPIATAVEP